MEFTKDIQFNTQPTAGQTVKVSYNGFLSNSEKLTFVYGFGEAWENTTYTEMTKTETGFEIDVPLVDSDTFNFCFKGPNEQWDNNYNCNYISPVLPFTQEAIAPKFDIDALIEEILQPIMAKPIVEAESINHVEMSTQTIDLGNEISNILSEISTKDLPNDLVEYNTLDEVLSCMIVEETPIDLLENTPIAKEQSLVTIDNKFNISPRKLSRFYLFKKKLKFTFYKALIKIPKMIFGTEN